MITTPNYKLSLMIPNQLNKDYTYNESILKIDCLLYNVIDKKITNIKDLAEDKIKTGTKFICKIKQDPNFNSIGYKYHNNQPILYIDPLEGMSFYDKEEKNFVIFDNKEWKNINYNNVTTSSIVKKSKDKIETEGMIEKHTPQHSQKQLQKTNNKFIGINKKYLINGSDISANHYLYLNDATEIMIDYDNSPDEITIILKQNYAKKHSIKWKANILWKNKQHHQITPKYNAIDVVKFYKLPETPHFLGKIIAVNFQF